MAKSAQDLDYDPTPEEVAKGQRDGGNLPAKQAPREVALKGASGSMTVSAEELRQLSFEELNKALGVSDSTEAIGTDQYGPILEDKHQLIGKPFLIVHWEFHKGDMGGFVSMWVLTPENARYIVNDGSTGIYAQLAALTQETGQDSMLACKHGLRVSQYEKELANGSVVQAETFYIDTKL